MPYELRRKTKEKCWEVINTTTGELHSKCTSKKKGEAQIRLLESLHEGSGIIEEAKKLYNRILPQRQSGVLRPKSRKLLMGIANEPITSMEVIRTPIESYINNVLNAISLGAFKKAVATLGYDKLFHLSLYINKKYVFHKIEVLTLDNAPSDIIKSNSEVKSVDLPSSSITISDLIKKTKEYMGDEKFTSYDPVNNNCQDLVLSVLKANNLSTSELQTFIKQDAQSIFSKLPSFVGKFAQGVTDVAGRFNRLIEGEGVLEDIGSLLGFGFAINLPQTTRDYIRKTQTSVPSGSGVSDRSSPIELHTILIPKSDLLAPEGSPRGFNKKSAIEWLKNHNFHWDRFRTTKNYMRFNQVLAVKGSSYYTKKLPNGVELVFMRRP